MCAALLITSVLFLIVSAQAVVSSNAIVASVHVIASNQSLAANGASGSATQVTGGMQLSTSSSPQKSTNQLRYLRIPGPCIAYLAGLNVEAGFALYAEQAIALALLR